MMYSGSIWPFQSKTGRSTTGTMVSPTRTRVDTSMVCCSKAAFLEAFSCMATVVHILVISLATSIFYYGNEKDLQFRGHTIESNVNGAELMIVGVTGALVNGLALVGLWSRQRLFLLPVIMFLIVNLLLDFITAVAFFCTHMSDDALANRVQLNNYEVTKLATPVRHSRDQAFVVLFPFFLVKMVLSFIYLRCLLDVYKRDPIMRTTRSPFKNGSKQKPSTEKENLRKFVECV